MTPELSLVWGVYAAPEETSSSELDLGDDGLQCRGSAGLFIGVVAVDGCTLKAASVIDWMQAAAVPEPGSWSLMFVGLAAIDRVARRPVVLLAVVSQRTNLAVRPRFDGMLS